MKKIFINLIVNFIINKEYNYNVINYMISKLFLNIEIINKI